MRDLTEATTLAMSAAGLTPTADGGFGWDGKRLGPVMSGSGRNSASLM